jgi:hypothetical protein
MNLFGMSQACILRRIIFSINQRSSGLVMLWIRSQTIDQAHRILKLLTPRVITVLDLGKKSFNTPKMLAKCRIPSLQKMNIARMKRPLLALSGFGSAGPIHLQRYPINMNSRAHELIDHSQYLFKLIYSHKQPS